MRTRAHFPRPPARAHGVTIWRWTAVPRGDGLVDDEWPEVAAGLKGQVFVTGRVGGASSLKHCSSGIAMWKTSADAQRAESAPSRQATSTCDQEWYYMCPLARLPQKPPGRPESPLSLRVRIRTSEPRPSRWCIIHAAANRALPPTFLIRYQWDNLGWQPDEAATCQCQWSPSLENQSQFGQVSWVGVGLKGR